MKKKNRYTHAAVFREVMKKFYVQPTSVKESIEYLRPHMWTLKQLYANSLENDIRLSKEMGFDSEPDTRSGEETYGYKSEESILCNLVYISDRWNAPFRLRWIIDLIENYKE